MAYLLSRARHSLGGSTCVAGACVLSEVSNLARKRWCPQNLVARVTSYVYFLYIYVFLLILIYPSTNTYLIYIPLLNRIKWYFNLSVLICILYIYYPTALFLSILTHAQCHVQGYGVSWKLLLDLLSTIYFPN